MQTTVSSAQQVVDRCLQLAAFSEEPPRITRTFLSAPMRHVHAHVRAWLEAAGANVRIDALGNLRGIYPARASDAQRILIGSHLDTVANAGAFDGILGVVMAASLVEQLDGRRLPFAIEVVGFSEEEGVRFGVPFIGSRGLIGEVDDELLAKTDANGVSVRDAIRGYGLDIQRITEAHVSGDAFAYLEIHIEQGPVLESLGLPLGVVENIVGQSRLAFLCQGAANHAGTTPMNLRKDALAGMAEWAVAVEREALAIPGLVATVGRFEARPGAGNVIAGSVLASLDVRHADDAIRRVAVEQLVACAGQITSRRGLSLSVEKLLDQPAVAMDPAITNILARAVESCGAVAQRMNSGAGHDAMIMARRMPSAMLFLRSPGGISHDPAETVQVADVAAALNAGAFFLQTMESRFG